MRKLCLIGVAIVALAACDPMKNEKVQAYQTVGGACMAATGALNTLAGMRRAGRLSPEAVNAVDLAADTVNPICGADNIPSYNSALATLNSQIWVLDEALRSAMGE